MILILIKFILFKACFATMPQCKEKCADDSSFSFCYTNGTLSSEHLKSCYFEHCALKDSRIINFELFYIILSESQESLGLNYLSNYIQKIHINKMNIGSLPKINNLYNLKTLKINFHKFYNLVNNENLPPNLEIIDLSDGFIGRIHDEFFVKFENLRELNLCRNYISFTRLEINSNLIKLIDLSFQSSLNYKRITKDIIKSITFHKNTSDPKLFINFDLNRMHTFPMILGKLRHIYYYKIGHQFNHEQLLNRDSIILSDGPIVIENFEISYQHFINSKVFKHFQCLLDYGVIRNVILTGDGKEEYLNHTIKINFENCKNYVSTSATVPAIPIPTITTSSPNKNTSENTRVFHNKKFINKSSQEIESKNKNRTINNSTFQSTRLLISTPFLSEKSLLNTKTRELNKLGEKQSSKIDNSFRNGILDFLIDNPGVVVSFFAFIFLFLLLLFACFNYAIEKVRS
ncbi:unnamed protein product [Brachionus calyciflorus]|uniref:Uncharacterized protein n=1 Tax=Brachionus calyciflorus TaxID=104777 RepID=A0A813VSZ6_9BILA|nr:unnamed protein product [Brachionus calyciflorus]